MDTHPFVAFARRSIAYYLEHGRLPHPEVQPDDPPPMGVFVSLHEAPLRREEEGRLRGCIGSITPTEPTFRDELARIAVSAATSDPRFPPLAAAELDDLDVTVYLLADPEPIEDISMLDPSRYGVVLQGPHGRVGLLLPAIPGITTSEQQVAIARQKGRFRTDDPVTMYRFEASILH